MRASYKQNMNCKKNPINKGGKGRIKKKRKKERKKEKK